MDTYGTNNFKISSAVVRIIRFVQKGLFALDFFT